jgi:hypothetical protein
MELSHIYNRLPIVPVLMPFNLEFISILGSF